MGGTSKYNIININLSKQEIITTSKNEQGLVYLTHLKIILKQKSLKSIIPGSRGLLKTIQGFG